MSHDTFAGRENSQPRRPAVQKTASPRNDRVKLAANPKQRDLRLTLLVTRVDADDAQDALAADDLAILAKAADRNPNFHDINSTIRGRDDVPGAGRRGRAKRAKPFGNQHLEHPAHVQKPISIGKL